jgi:23S rRNA pseudouridine2605 synthase
VSAGRVAVNGKLARDPEQPVDLARDRLTLDDRPVTAAQPIYLMLNKPRGLVTTSADERARPTVYQCLEGAELPWLAPVGRLDKASEGLLLFTNDSRWAATLLDPATHVDKTYHVKIDRLPSDDLIAAMTVGKQHGGERLRAKQVSILRQGTRSGWLEVVLDEGRNRHIRRLLDALDVQVLRLVRVAIGPLSLGDLDKGGYRLLSSVEVAALAPARKL